MMDIQGILDAARPSSSSLTPLERYCGSCIAKTARSYSLGSTVSGPDADNFPGRSVDLISNSPSRPLIGIRTRVPFLFIRSDSAGKHIRCALCPAKTIFVANKDP